MTRAGIAPATLAALESQDGSAMLFLELDLDGGAERFWTGTATILTDGGTKSWAGVGALASIEAIEEGLELSPYAVRVGLSGLLPAVVDLVFATELHGRGAKLYISALADGGGLTADPDVLWSGYIQDAQGTLGDDDGDSVLLTLESEFRTINRAPSLRYTHAQLQAEFPGDLGLEYIDQVPLANTVWRGAGTRLGSGPTVPEARDRFGNREGEIGPR